jgi:glycosyltransferase involved in cell wall biosynthesis
LQGAPLYDGAAMLVGFDVTIAARAATGVGVYARELGAALAGRSCTIRAWQRSLGRPGRWSRPLNAMRLTSWLLLEIPRRVRRESVDVYHAVSSLGPLRPACPYVMSVHDATLLTARSHYGWADRLYHRVFSVLAARRADAILVPSAAARRDVARAYRIPEARIHVVHLGLSAHFRPVPAARRASLLERLGLRAPYVLFVGARPPRKNIEALLAALAKVAGAGRADLQLAIAGPADPGDRRLRALAERLGLDSAVRWLGWIRDEDLPALYGGAVCLVYPSLAEGFGLPIIEAMASGTAVITSDRSSMAEIAGDAALLVDPESPPALAEGLRRLTGDASLREELIARGAARAREFAWEDAAAATETVYRQAARQIPVSLSPGPVR